MKGTVCYLIPYSRKKKFIKQIKSFIKAKNYNRKVAPKINFAGHGLKCIDENNNESWCMALPSKNVAPKCIKKVSMFDVFKLIDGCKDYVITTQEVLKEFNPDLFVADACHSGQMALDISRLNSMTTVIASTLSTDLANDEGELFKILNKLVDSDDKDLCKLDLNGDGHISLQESVFGIYSAEVHEYRFSMNIVSRPKNRFQGILNRFRGVVYCR